MRALKFIIAILLLPACIGATSAAWQTGRIALGGANLGTALAFGAGYLLWLLVFIFLPPAVRTYVLGHELTHAIWALLMGARVSGLSVRKAGGQVRTNKTNWAITLAPYFFPFYAVLFMVGFFITHAIWDLTAQFWILFFLVGLGWSFHVTFTIMVLFTVSQPDVKSQGALFSAVVIYLMNLLVMTVTVALLSQSLTFAKLATAFGDSLPASYVWTLDNCRALWEHVRVVWSQR